MRETTKIQRETEGHCQAWMTKGSIEKYGGTILRMFCQCFDMGLFPVVRQFRHFPSRFWTAQPFADGCVHQPFCCVLKRGKVGNHRVTTEESCSYWKKGGGTRGTHHDTSLEVFPLFWGEPSCIVEGRVHIDLNLSPVLIGVHPTWKVVHSHGCSPALGTRHIRRIRSHVYLLVI